MLLHRLQFVFLTWQRHDALRAASPKQLLPGQRIVSGSRHCSWSSRGPTFKLAPRLGSPRLPGARRPAHFGRRRTMPTLRLRRRTQFILDWIAAFSGRGLVQASGRSRSATTRWLPRTRNRKSAPEGSCAKSRPPPSRALLSDCRPAIEAIRLRLLGRQRWTVSPVRSVRISCVEGMVGRRLCREDMAPSLHPPSDGKGDGDRSLLRLVRLLSLSVLPPRLGSR